MCHAFLNDSRFYRFLFEIDQDIAHQVQAEGCSCGGVLHSARYPRKPRGVRSLLDEAYESRLSFCCAVEGCRRRRTPPSVRFLGRKVYLGVIVILITALEHGLPAKRRQHLIETLDICSQTLSRWRKWWREVFPASRCWQAMRGQFIPPVEVSRLPGALLGRLSGEGLSRCLCHLLGLLAPITAASWSGNLRMVTSPQKM
ncbi:MAG: hypothetical protein L3J26_12770 [Candidatus Polarisedimenticolaceae bacterium]|nr:hypothetical protein [Candidatus Polarisedimenticolaceae bacterium]